MNAKQQHALARTHRITSSRIPVIATGNFRAWNTLAKTMREAKPAPIYSNRKTGVASLDWGHRHEDWLCAQFWIRHPEYDVHDERWCWWHQPENKVFWEMCGTSPDRTLYQDVEGFPKRVSGVEAKNPFDPWIHRGYRDAGVLPEEYRPQVYWHMMVADTPDWWFVSGDPRLEDPELNYFEVLVERDPGYENMLLHKVNRFIGGYLNGETFHPTEYNKETYEDIF
jgi:hypothetical protein